MNEARAVLELAYYVAAGPVLAIIAAIGLWQLKIARKTARTSAMRDAFRLTADQCAHYLLNIIPKINTLDQAIEKIRSFLKSPKLASPEKR